MAAKAAFALKPVSFSPPISLPFNTLVTWPSPRSLYLPAKRTADGRAEWNINGAL